MKKWKLLPILGVTTTVATLGSTLVACNEHKDPTIEKFILDNWITDKLVLNDVSLEAGKKYKIIVNLNKFEADFGTHPQLKLTDTKYDAEIQCDVFYNKKALSFNTDYVCVNDGDNLVCYFQESFILEKDKELYYLISIPDGALNKNLYFENR